MTHSRLNIVKEIPITSIPKRRREEALEKFNQLWEKDPDQFNPDRNVMEKERIRKTLALIEDFFSPLNRQVADLGCGYATISQKLCREGAAVLAVDVATVPLALLKDKNIDNLSTRQDYVPRTILADDFYDLVISTEVIAFLPPDEYRLYVSELARIVKSNGCVVCSTAIDIFSEDALQRFANLAETEFKIEKWEFSYHYLYIRLRNMLTAPIFKNLLSPLVNFVDRSRWLLNSLEKISRFFWADAGISHAIFIGTRRPLLEAPPPEELPVERKQKRQVWE